MAVFGMWRRFKRSAFRHTWFEFLRVWLSQSVEALFRTALTYRAMQHSALRRSLAVLNKADVVAGVQTPGFQYFGPPQGLFALAAAELLPSSSNDASWSAGCHGRVRAAENKIGPPS